MHEHRMIEHGPKEGLYALRCSSGRYRKVRALSSMPLEEAHLLKAEPGLGFGISVCSTSGAIYRLLFESVNHAEYARATRRMLSQPPVTQSNGFSAAGSSD